MKKKVLISRRAVAAIARSHESLMENSLPHAPSLAKVHGPARVAKWRELNSERASVSAESAKEAKENMAMMKEVFDVYLEACEALEAGFRPRPAKRRAA